MYSLLACVFLLGFSGYVQSYWGESSCITREVNDTVIVSLSQQAVQFMNTNQTEYHRELMVVLEARSEVIDTTTVEYHLHLQNSVTILQTTTTSSDDNVQQDEIEERITINATVVTDQEPMFAVLPPYEPCPSILD